MALRGENLTIGDVLRSAGRSLPAHRTVLPGFTSSIQAWPITTIWEALQGASMLHVAHQLKGTIVPTRLMDTVHPAPILAWVATATLLMLSALLVPRLITGKTELAFWREFRWCLLQLAPRCT